MLSLFLLVGWSPAHYKGGIGNAFERSGRLTRCVYNLRLEAGNFFIGIGRNPLKRPDSEK